MIYVLRHGLTDSNVADVVRGQGNEEPLNKIGVEQAKSARDKLRDIDFDAVYCSPMLRARQTYDIVRENTDRIAIIDERLLPRNYGPLLGMSGKEYNELGYWNRELNKKEEGLEDLIKFEKRVFDFYDEIIKKHEGKNVLVITHGSVTKISQGYFLGLPKEDDYKNYKTRTGEIWVFGARGEPGIKL